MNSSSSHTRYTRAELVNRQDVSRNYLRNLVGAIALAKMLFEKLNGPLCSVTRYEHFFYPLGKKQRAVFFRNHSSTENMNVIHTMLF